MVQKATISAAVNSAFSAAGELVKTAILDSTVVSGFDFSTGTVDAAADTTTVEVIPYETGKKDRDSFTTELLMRSVDFPLTSYSFITYDGVSHSIESIEYYEGITVLKVRHRDA